MTLSSDSNKDIKELLGVDKQSTKQKRKILLIIIAAITILAGWLIISGFLSKKPVQYKTEEAKKGSLTITVTATGELKPVNQVDVGTEVSGTIKTVAVDYNDRVKAGQMLASLDTTKLKAQVLQSKGALESSKAKLLRAQASAIEAKTNLDRLEKAKKLSKGKIPSSYELDAAKAALKKASADEAMTKAEITQAQAALDAYSSDLDKAVIKAPISGIILKRNCEPGQTVAAALQTPVLFTMAEDLSVMELHVKVDEADVGKVKEGQSATFTVDAYPDRDFPAVITQVRFASQTESGVVTYETLMSVDNKDLLLRPGMTATAEITVRHIEEAMLIPNAALRFIPPTEEGKKAPSRGLIGGLFPRPPMSRTVEPVTVKNGQGRVWTVKNNVLTPVPVKTGDTDGTMTEILTGDISPGLPIVTDMITANK